MYQLFVAGYMKIHGECYDKERINRVAPVMDYISKYNNGSILRNDRSTTTIITFKLNGVHYGSNSKRHTCYRFDDNHWKLHSDSTFLKIWYVITGNVHALRPTKRSKKAGIV